MTEISSPSASDLKELSYFINPRLLSVFSHNIIRSNFVTVHSVHSNLAKIHSRLPAAMEFWLVSGFWHIHAKTPRGIVVCEQQHSDFYNFDYK